MSVSELKQALADARTYLMAVVDQVGDQWETQIYAEGAAWTARQLLIHLAVTDQGQTNSVIKIAAGENPIPADFDLQRYNHTSIEKRNDMTLDQAWQMLNASRAQLNDWLDRLDESALARTGRHATLKTISVAEFLETMALHERTHAQDIARVLALEV